VAVKADELAKVLAVSIDGEAATAATKVAGGDAYEVQDLGAGLVRVVLLRPEGAVVHEGTPESVRARCAVDAHPDDRAAIVEVALDKARYPDEPIKEVVVEEPLPVDLGARVDREYRRPT
jgi:hypothetical protein